MKRLKYYGVTLLLMAVMIVMGELLDHWFSHIIDLQWATWLPGLAVGARHFDFWRDGRFT